MGGNKPLIDPETAIVTRGKAEGLHVDDACEAYLARCESLSELPTLVEWALELGYSSAQAMGDFERKHCATPCAPPLKRARAKIENKWAKAVSVGGNNQAGLIFGLKNMFGWRDKSDDELRQSVVITLSDEVSSAIERLAETLLGR